GIAPALDCERAWPSDEPGCSLPLPGAEPARDRATLRPVAAGAGGRGPRPGATRGAERAAGHRSRARNGHVPPGATPPPRPPRLRRGGRASLRRRAALVAGWVEGGVVAMGPSP